MTETWLTAHHVEMLKLARTKRRNYVNGWYLCQKQDKWFRQEQTHRDSASRPVCPECGVPLRTISKSPDRSQVKRY